MVYGIVLATLMGMSIGIFSTILGEIWLGDDGKYMAIYPQKSRNGHLQSLEINAEFDGISTGFYWGTFRQALFDHQRLQKFTELSREKTRTNTEDMVDIGGSVRCPVQKLSGNLT